MKIQLIILVLFLYSSNCKGQVKRDSIFKKETAIETFDVNRYKNLAINPKTGLYILPNGDEVQCFTGNGGIGFVERTKIKNSAYCIVKVFFQNNILQAKGDEFYGFPIGIHNEYDEKVI
jgi:hypothetical protein